jgi:hypothetical protein
MLRNKRYVGVYIYGKNETPDGMPRIIDDELFERVQLMLDKNKVAAARTRGAGEYLLTTKLFCGHCREMMTGYGGTGKSGRAYHYYACKNAKKKLCDKKIVDKQLIEDRVIAECLKLLTDENISKIAKAVAEVCASDYDSSTLKLLRRNLKSAETAIENLWKLAESGQEVEGLQDRIAKRNADKKDIEARIAVEENREVFFTEEQIRFFLSKLKSGNLNDLTVQRGLINIFVSAIYLYDDRLLLVLNGSNVPIEVTAALLDEIAADADSAKCSLINAQALPSYHTIVDTK